MENKQTILVTGSAGFIGFSLIKKLLADGMSVVGVDNFNDYYDVSLKEDRNRMLIDNPNFILERGDLTNLDFVKSIFQKHKIDKVCHLAAQAGVRYSLSHPHAYIQANLVGFTNIIDEVRRAGIKDFVYASSSSVYGNNKKTPFSVEDNVDKPISLYAATKKANELIAHTYHHLYGMNCTGLRFFTVYGPYGRPDMALFLFTKAILEDKPINVYNYGKMKRDFTYIDDIVNGIIKSLEKAYPCEIFNLGGDETIELNYFIESIEKELGKKAKRNLMPIQDGDVPETSADIEHTREKLGWEPAVKIEAGIARFVEWYREYYKA